MKHSEAAKRFDVSMNLLDDAIDNVICNSEYTSMSEILIDYLRGAANRIEQMCIEEFGEDWRELESEES